MPINRGHVEKVEDASDRSTTDHIMKEISINVGSSSDNRVAAGGRTVLWNCLTGSCVAGVKPIKLLLGDVRIIRLVSSDANDTVFELREVSDDTLDAVKVSLTRTRAEARQGHNGGTNVESTNLDSLLE